MLAIDLFLTLDGVGQAPGGPQEDPSSGFPFGGWQAPFLDEEGGGRTVDRILGIDALLLGRRTYDIFAGYWPQHADDPIGAHFARVPKYVASRSTIDPAWDGTTRIGADLPAEVGALRERHGRVHVIGSLDLAQTLLAERLYDELALWVFPVVLGSGKRAFPGGALPTALVLQEPAFTTPSGAVLLRYAPEGDPVTGEIGT